MKTSNAHRGGESEWVPKCYWTKMLIEAVPIHPLDVSVYLHTSMLAKLESGNMKL